MVNHKPFSRTEMKILIFNKVKNKNISYEDACAELEQEIDIIIANDLKEEQKQRKIAEREKKVAEKEKLKQNKFKDEFVKLTKDEKRKRTLQTQKS